MEEKRCLAEYNIAICGLATLKGGLLNKISNAGVEAVPVLGTVQKYTLTVNDKSSGEYLLHFFELPSQSLIKNPCIKHYFSNADLVLFLWDQGETAELNKDYWEQVEALRGVGEASKHATWWLVAGSGKSVSFPEDAASYYDLNASGIIPQLRQDMVNRFVPKQGALDKSVMSEQQSTSFTFKCKSFFSLFCCGSASASERMGRAERERLLYTK